MLSQNHNVFLNLTKKFSVHVLYCNSHVVLGETLSMKMCRLKDNVHVFITVNVKLSKMWQIVSFKLLA